MTTPLSLDAEVESIIWSFQISFNVSQEHIVKLNTGEQFKQRGASFE
jgi:hypothetical protein